MAKNNGDRMADMCHGMRTLYGNMASAAMAYGAYGMAAARRVAA